MPTQRRHKTSCKVWIEYRGKPILGKGGAQILEQIEHDNSISKAARRLGMSYRYVWNYLQKIEKTLGKQVMKTYRGGKSGGGGAKLTQLGKNLLEEYKLVEQHLSAFLSDAERMKGVKSEISVSDRLRGKIVDIEKKASTVQVKIEIITPVVVTASISHRVAKQLGVKVGDAIETVMKAAEIVKAK
jgi:molybdate transport system regulatory protein